MHITAWLANAAGGYISQLINQSYKQMGEKSAVYAVGLELTVRLQELKKLREAYVLLGGELDEDGMPKDGAAASADQQSKGRHLVGLRDAILQHLGKAAGTSEQIAISLYDEEKFPVSATDFRKRVRSSLATLDREGYLNKKADMTSTRALKPWIFSLKKRKD